MIDVKKMRGRSWRFSTLELAVGIGIEELPMETRLFYSNQPLPGYMSSRGVRNSHDRVHTAGSTAMTG
jgi:hypothetical protein